MPESEMIYFNDALRMALRDELSANEDVMLMGEDIAVYGGAFGVTRGLLEEFGDKRVIDTPISEGGFVGMGIGAALMGARPVLEIMFMDFATLVMDQMVNQAAKLHYVFGEQARCPLVVRMANGGGKSYGPTHSQSLEAWFMHVPGLKVVAPSNHHDAYALLRAAIRDNNPVVFLEHKLLYPLRGSLLPDYKNMALPEIGKAHIVQQGEDITLITYSYLVLEAEKAIEQLTIKGLSVELIDLRSLVPLDRETIIESVSKTGRALIITEDTKTAGVGAEIASVIAEFAFDYLEAPVKRLSAPDIPISAAPSLEDAALPRSADIVAYVDDIMAYGQ